MSVSNNLRICATDGNEEIAKKNYRVIRSLSNKAAEKFNITVDDVISFLTRTKNMKTSEIKGLRTGSFNNYCRNGRVSEYTCNILNNFFDDEISYAILIGQKMMTYRNAAIIFGVLMEKLNSSNITKVRLGTSVDNAIIYFRKKDFIEIILRSLMNSGIENLDNQIVEVSEFDALYFEIECIQEENNECEDYNELFIGLGLDPIIHENEEFIQYITPESLWHFDLYSLKKCYESYKKVTDIFEAIVRIKDIKSGTSDYGRIL